MFEKPEVLTIASSLAAHAAERQSAIARNVANADTPGYRAQDLPDFTETNRAQDAGRMRQTRSGQLGVPATPQSYVAGERAPQGTLSPNGNSVSLEAEMVKAADVKRDHDLALAIYGKSMSILRASLGRR
jgi:flagellar basal-body rod protein FlgB